MIEAERGVVDLVDQAQVRTWVAVDLPNGTVLAAAKVGGIKANSEFPGDFLNQNVMIEANILQAAHETDVARVLFLGPSCINSKMAQQPIPEDALLTGPPVFQLKDYSGYEHVNVGSGVEVTILDLAQAIAKLVGYDANLTSDANKSEGTLRNLLDSEQLYAMGWNRARPMEERIEDAHSHFLVSNA